MQLRYLIFWYNVVMFFSASSAVEKHEPIFVIQKHKAKHIHYDLRLESDGVLKSWALPKGPPRKIAEKRLAIQTQDHPIEYAHFQGVIPSGDYGAGTVNIWDAGTFCNITQDKSGKPISFAKGLKNGRLKIELDGKKLRGQYSLIKTKSAKKSSWLFLKLPLKRKEESASFDTFCSAKLHKTLRTSGFNRPARGSFDKLRMSGEPSHDESVVVLTKTEGWRADVQKSSNIKNASFNFLPESERKKLKKSYPKVPDTPMLAGVDTTPLQAGTWLSGVKLCEWLYERKFDGQRCLCLKQGSNVKLFSRNKKLINNSYPEIVQAIKKQMAQEFIIDGEIAAFDGDTTSFSKLQERMFITDRSKALKSKVPVQYCVFDILHLDGFDTTGIPLEYRKQLLEKVIDFEKPLRYADHKKTDGAAYFKQACDAGWEGLVAKRASSTYQCRRTRDWIKLKCAQAQEFVVGGYTSPRGKRVGLGALLVGYYDKHELRYAGKVGTGFTRETLQILMKRLKPLKRKLCPFADFHASSKLVQWVKPCLVAQIEFAQWTKDGKLRHPRFLGLRLDKNASEAIRETGVVQEECETIEHAKNGHAGTDRTLEIDIHSIDLCHEDKIMFPESGITKRDIIDYYYKIAPRMLSYLKNHPLASWRFPDGITGKNFYQRNVPDYYPDWIGRVEIPKLSDGHNQMVVCNNAATLVYLANQAVITPHVCLSCIDNLDYPDRMIFDLDPSTDDDFATVCKTALRLKEILESKGLVPFAMTTGSRGLHVVVPLISNLDFDSVRAYASEIADQVVAQDPQHLTTALNKRKRHGRIFVDVGRNAYAQTAVAPYAIRAHPGAPVATPLHWRELEQKDLTSQRYTIKNVFQRLSEQAVTQDDPWKDMAKSARSL